MSADIRCVSLLSCSLALLLTLSAGVPVGGGTSTNGGGVAAKDFALSDASATGVSLTMKRPADKLASYAGVIVYSMAVDAPESGGTPMMSHAPSRAASTADLRKASASQSQPSLLATALNTAAGAKRPRTYLAGSKALDSLAKLMQATESFFHPSSYGTWALSLSRFLLQVTFEFMKRWREEERPGCRTPDEWRLTPAIRREFVQTMRTVALLAMFSRDPITISNAQAALKTLGYLEPDLIFPALLERAYPALETLVETHRTTSIISALAAVSAPMISRSVYPAGAKHLLPLLELCIPGLDVNDPIKTMSTSMFVIQAVNSIMIDDLTRAEVAEIESMDTDEAVPVITAEEEDGEPKLTRAQEDAVLRDTTADFPDWVCKFFRQVIVVFEALPEPGKGNRTGGKSEETMTQTMIAACDQVCMQLSDPLFDMALDMVYEHITTSIHANSSKAVSGLIACFTRASPAKTFAKFFPRCDAGIRAELESGASSVPTTSSSTPVDSDVTLHWWLGIFGHILAHAGNEAVMARQDELASLLGFMTDRCKSERGYRTAASSLTVLLSYLTGVWTNDARSVNPDIWNSEGEQRLLMQEITFIDRFSLDRVEARASQDVGTRV